MKDSYGFIKVLERKNNLVLCVYKNVLEPHDIIYTIEKAGNFIHASESYFIALHIFNWESQKKCLIV